MSDFFYKPKIGPEREYLSEKDFEDLLEEEEEQSLPPEETSDEEIKDEAIQIVHEIEKLKKVIDILPGSLPQTFRDVLNKIKHDILNPPVPEPIIPPGQDPEEQVTPEPSFDPPDREIVELDPSPIDIPNYNENGSITIGGSQDSPIYLFPQDNGISVVTSPTSTLMDFVRQSFLKDKNDMYGNFVKRLKLMLQQYMRELLYVAKIGEFDSYLDLYVKFDTPSAEIPKNLMAAADRITKNQIARDQKTRLLNKIFNIDQTVSHLIANKVSYEQRQRYYDIDYLKAKDYIETQENDELRKQRLEYDKKYEQNMYNYYKYLTGAAILTDEVLKTFLSEARGKALLNKNGIDTKKGLKEEQEKQKQVEAELKKEAEEMQKREEEKHQELLNELGVAGRDPTYTGTYGDKAGTTNPSSTPYSPEVEPVSGSNAEKIVQMALQAWKKRGPHSGNPIEYSMSKRTHKIFDSNAGYSDCSAFVRGVVLAATNIDVGVNTSDQVNKNKSREWVYSISDMQPGDLIYFKSLPGDSYQGHAISLNGKSYNVSHALIYLGNYEAIECTSGANGLRKIDFSSGWNKTSYMEKRFMGAFRL